VFSVEIYTPEKQVFKGEASHLVAPGKGGFFGVLTGHAPILASLNPGELKIDMADNSKKLFAIPGGGFLEMDNNKLIVLADSVELKN